MRTKSPFYDAAEAAEKLRKRLLAGNDGLVDPIAQRADIEEACARLARGRRVPRRLDEALGLSPLGRAIRYKRLQREKWRQVKAEEKARHEEPQRRAAQVAEAGRQAEARRVLSALAPEESEALVWAVETWARTCHET